MSTRRTVPGGETFEAGSPIEAGDMVVVGVDGKVHASPRRHTWDGHHQGAVCKVCGRSWAETLRDDWKNEPCPG